MAHLSGTQTPLLHIHRAHSTRQHAMRCVGGELRTSWTDLPHPSPRSPLSTCSHHPHILFTLIPFCCTFITTIITYSNLRRSHFQYFILFGILDYPKRFKSTVGIGFRDLIHFKICLLAFGSRYHFIFNRMQKILYGKIYRVLPYGYLCVFYFGEFIPRIRILARSRMDKTERMS